MIDFTEYTNKAIQQAMLDRVPAKYDRREGSLIQTAVAPVAWFLEGFALTLDQMQQDGNPYDAEGEALDYLVSTRGLTRKAATYAEAVGLFDIEIPEGTLFRTINGADSITFTSGDAISGAVGAYRYTLTADTAGAIGNAYTGAIIPVTAFPNSENLGLAEIEEITTVGTDTETDDSLRDRFFASFDATPYGGNISQYRQAILAIDGVGAVQIYPANYYHGGGTVLCSILGDDLLPAETALVNAVQAAICPNSQAYGVGIAPIGAAVDITTGTEYALDIVVNVSFVSGVSNGVQTYYDAIKDAIEEYIASVRETWGTATVTHSISYNVAVYLARLISAVISIPAITNVQSLTINGSAADVILTESASVQQVPVLGTLTVNEV